MRAFPSCLVPAQEHEHATDLQAASTTQTYNPGGSTLNGTAFSNFLVAAHKQSSVSGAAVPVREMVHGTPSVDHPKRSQPES